MKALTQRNKISFSRGSQLAVLGSLLVVVSLLLAPGSAVAKVERMPIKSEATQAKERLAKQNLKHIDLQRIQDPEARKAIREILRYLKLNSKAQAQNVR